MKCNTVQRLDGVFQSESKGKKEEMKNRQKQGIRSHYSFIILSSANKNVRRQQTLQKDDGHLRMSSDENMIKIQYER